MKNPIEQENIRFSEIATEIEAMAEKDQAMRARAEENRGVIESEEDDNLDRKNTERMKELVAEIGLPTKSKVGEEASHKAWLLVQHADHDVPFQKHYLQLMKEAYDGDVDKKDIAYLEDRVRVNEGMSQLYGTQFYIDQVHKMYVPRPIEDSENVDKRRQEIGLDVMEEYAKNWDDINEELKP